MYLASGWFGARVRSLAEQMGEAAELGFLGVAPAAWRVLRMPVVAGLSES